ncbi:MAG: hypothetical protein AABZ31_08430 [Bdellovibrionota bacterium]
MVNLAKSQRGQIAVEMVLLIALSIGIFIGISSIFREKQYFASILSKPWTAISAMIQDGVWIPGELHPNHRNRWVSVDGEKQ